MPQTKKPTNPHTSVMMCLFFLIRRNQNSSQTLNQTLWPISSAVCVLPYHCNYLNSWFIPSYTAYFILLGRRGESCASSQPEGWELGIMCCLEKVSWICPCASSSSSWVSTLSSASPCALQRELHVQLQRFCAASSLAGLPQHFGWYCADQGIPMDHPRHHGVSFLKVCWQHLCSCWCCWGIEWWGTP